MRGAPTSTSVPSSLSLAAVLIAVGGCAAGSEHHDPVLDGGPADAAPSADVASADAGTNDATAAADGPSLVGDGTTLDVACHHLNIGILGNPGQNPSSNFDAWLTSAGTSVQRIQTTAPTPAITSATLQPFDVVILDWLTRDYTAAEASVLSAFVSAGGGVIAMSGYDNNTVDDWHANSLLAPLGVAFTGPLIDTTSSPVTDFTPHPITAGITSVTFYGGYAVADLGGPGDRTPLAFLPDAADGGLVTVSYAIQLASGRGFVWGDEWISFDSEWSTLPEIKQLWVQIFAWVAPASGCALQPSQ